MDSQYGISGSGKYQLNITGRGKVALMTSGAPLMMQVTPGQVRQLRRRRRSSPGPPSLRVQMQAQTHPSGVWRRRGNTGEGWELQLHRAAATRWCSPASCCRRRTLSSGRAAAPSSAWASRGARGQNQSNAWS